jgi:hypothetical protein
MGFIDTNPKAFKSATITIGDDEYQAHVSSVEFDSGTPGTQRWSGLDGKTHSDATPGEPGVKLAVIQEWGNPDSLCNFLYDHAGEVKTITLEYDSGPTFGTEVTLVKPIVGGPVNQFNESTVTLPSTEITKVPEA